MSTIQETMNAILNQYKENFSACTLSLPTALVLIPMSIFFLSPTASRGIFLFGAIVTSIISLIFTQTEGQHFMSNNPSFHGMALGYVVGYLLMENIMSLKPGSTLSTCVMGMILAVSVTVSLDTSRIRQVLITCWYRLASWCMYWYVFQLH